MKEPVTISKNSPLLASQHFKKLREAGLKHIEQLSSDLWTDYNIHDPGITLLEVLCYAITDLGYRTSCDIKDLLADTSVSFPARREQFYTAREILTCHPVTLSDYRKLLIDIEGVKNAWLSLVEDPKPDIYLNCKKSKLQYDDEEGLEELNLRGLYDVTLELEEDPGAGDLNNYCFEIPLYSDVAKHRESLLILLPDWSQYMEHHLRAGDIRQIRLLRVKVEDRFRFSGKVVIKRKDNSEISFAASLKATDKDVDTSHIRQRIKKETVVEQYQQKINAALRISWEAWERLHAHRNLCEDFNQFRSIEIEDIGICADIAVTPDAELEEVLAQIYYHIRLHIAPFLHFYTLKELLDKDIPTEDIFNGPALNHGFIDDKELEDSQLKEEILVSDLIRIIMDVKGVAAVREITLASACKGEIQNPKVEWRLKVGKGRAPRLSIDKSKILLYKENIPYRPAGGEVEKLIREYKTLERETKLAYKTYDLPVPEGINRNIADYTSVQNDLPNTYGVNRNGVPGLLTDLRRGQAKQLKAYLTFFDQLLANYLAQLANIKNLFSFSPDIDRTYYYQVLYNLPEGFGFSEGDPGEQVLYSKEESPRIYQVLLDFIRELEASGDSSVDFDDYGTFKSYWEAYKKETGLDDPASTHIVARLNRIVEDKQIFEERRNRFLDHLLARFGEQFTDYALLLFTLERGDDNTLKFREKVPADLIEDKINFLQEYPELSGERGKAFNYKNESEIWATNNVSGLEKRVARLLGIEDYRRRNLSCKDPEDFFEIFKDKTGEWRFRFRDHDGNILLRSEGYTRKAGCEQGIDSVKRNGRDRENYDLLRAKDGRYYFNLKAQNGEIITTSRLYKTKGERDQAVALMINILEGDCNEEGFHLVEHILLRPGQEPDQLLPVCVTPGCDDCPGFRDPYSFRASLIVPYWPDRFDNMEFRHFLERTVRMEAPAHVHIKICWADQEDMKRFEKIYHEWLIEKAKPESEERPAKLKELIEVMASVRSVYPKATLHDCEEDEDENLILLDNTILGTIKPE